MSSSLPKALSSRLASRRWSHCTALFCAGATAKAEPALATETVSIEDFRRKLANRRRRALERGLGVEGRHRRTITGTFISDELKNRYEVTGQPGTLPHQAKFEVFLANAQMQIDAYLWTKDESKMAGTLTMAGRKFGFVANRTE